mmetsp:Transcript_9745/g.20605  ORF Transcript_9745/g.20605 Transcript_9745/m.20605 type:complete len:248 (-) Transcript_9745:1467-2210(-)
MTIKTASANAVGEQQSALSEYEQARARNIERNNARLRSLGLISIAEERKSNDTAWGRHIKLISNDDDDDEESSSEEEYIEGETSSKKKKKKRSRCSALPPREGSRKSRRLMHLPSENDPGDIDDETLLRETVSDRKERIQKEREALVVECREARQRAAIEVAKAGVEIAGEKNPTATYEHCLMRVRSMTEKGLMNRVRAIERAAGKHCVVKMAIFKSCLQDENMWDLAKLASESLERLKGLLPPPSN